MMEEFMEHGEDIADDEVCRRFRSRPAQRVFHKGVAHKMPSPTLSVTAKTTDKKHRCSKENANVVNPPELGVGDGNNSANVPPKTL